MLDALRPEERDRLLATARRARFKRGEVIFREGDPGDSVYLLETGRLAVHVSTPGGESAILNVLRPGDFFGELALLRESPRRRRSATISALEAAQTLTFPGDVFDALRQSHPALERLVSGMLAQRVDQLGLRLLESLYLGVDRRVYRRLAELVDIYRDDDAGSVSIPLTQDDLAFMAGATRPTVNQALQKLASRGVVALGRRQIEVLDPTALNRYV